jgi:hypothetical protein
MSCRSGKLLAVMVVCMSFATHSYGQVLISDPAKLQPRERVATQADRSGRLNNAADALPGAMDKAQRAAVEKNAKTELKTLWPSIQQAYPFLGDRGLLVQINVEVLLVSSPTPVPLNKLGQVFIVGAGVDPAHAWAESRDALVAASSGYRLAPDESWFLWISPGKNGWPANAPSYKAAVENGLLDRKEPHGSVVTPGTTIRSRMLANDGLRQEANLRAIESVSRAAQAHAETERLRQVASQLRQNAKEAMVKLGQINERLESDLKAAARANEALMILDGTIAIGSAASKISDVLAKLGPDAPASPSGNMTEAQARTYIDDLANKEKASTIELQTQKTMIIRGVDGQVQGFHQEFKGTEFVMPDKLY